MVDDMFNEDFGNPFKPGAGHMPPYLAGRKTEQNEFRSLLAQKVILKNMILTGLRGVGKTVLLQTLKPIALKTGWFWVGTDLSETSSLKEENIATRLLSDLALATSSLVLRSVESRKVGFNESAYVGEATPYGGADTTQVNVTLDYRTLQQIYHDTPGLASDKLKRVLEIVAHVLCNGDRRGIVFAYDEAQNLADHASKEQYPLSLLLDVFQSIQRKEIPFMLVLTGLPTLHAKLVDARTYSERMFHIVELRKLSKEQCREAILYPIQEEGCPVQFNETSVDLIIETSGGYPYFIQFICREVYDVFIQKRSAGEEMRVPIAEIINKLDSDFSSGRWSRATDRQRELLTVIATLESCDDEFTAVEVAQASRKVLRRGFTPSHVSQVFAALCQAGLVYKNRHGKYCYAVPLLGDFIKRQEPYHIIRGAKTDRSID